MPFAILHTIISATWQRLQHALPACRRAAVRQKTGESVKVMVALRIVMIPGRASIREAAATFPPKSVVEDPPKGSLESLFGYSRRRVHAVPAPSLRPGSIVMIGTAPRGASSEGLGGGGRKRSPGKGLGV